MKAGRHLLLLMAATGRCVPDRDWTPSLLLCSDCASTQQPLPAPARHAPDLLGLPAGVKTLVVAFGSAPGVPNWGGLLKRLVQSEIDRHQLAFDILYVVDGARMWYSGTARGALYRQTAMMTNRSRSPAQLGRPMHSRVQVAVL